MQSTTVPNDPSAQPAKPKRSKRMFTPEEDMKLRHLVETHGDHNWKLVASNLPGRTTRQCRERWRNYLSPLVKSITWTPEQDQRLEQLTELYARHWSNIAKLFPFQTNTSVKNRWVKLQRQKRIRESCCVDVVPTANPPCLIDFWLEEPCADNLDYAE